MIKIYYDIAQRTPEWFALRCGKFTASKFENLFSKTSTDKYQSLINTVVYERLTGNVPESYENEWMKRGSNLEDEALEKYEFETFNKTVKVGFVEYDDWTGCSPDSLVSTEGLVQVKCPKHNTAIYYRLNPQKAVDSYVYQLQGEIGLTGRKWTDLCIYHPYLNPQIIRVNKDESIIAEIQTKLTEAIEEAKRRIERISIEG